MITTRHPRSIPPPAPDPVAGPAAQGGRDRAGHPGRRREQAALDLLETADPDQVEVEPVEEEVEDVVGEEVAEVMSWRSRSRSITLQPAAARALGHRGWTAGIDQREPAGAPPDGAAGSSRAYQYQPAAARSASGAVSANEARQP